MNPPSLSLVPLLLLILSIAQALPAHAETKVITAEATYIMGDGESPAFAEAMVLQKAKQVALEQAGTYVESYTKIQNYDLTAEEIQIIAGGVLEVEVLDKTRTLVSDGLRFFVRIKASVTIDKMQELAQRIKGKNVAEEYKKLQEDYARLTKEIETWKQLVSKTMPGPEREAALDQIREREKAFADVQRNETALFQRLVSGQALILSSKNKLEELDALIRFIREEGHIIEIGQVTAHHMPGSPSHLMLSIPVTLRIADSLLLRLTQAARMNGGDVRTTGSANAQFSIVWETQRSPDLVINNKFFYREGSILGPIEEFGLSARGLRLDGLDVIGGLPAIRFSQNRQIEAPFRTRTAALTLILALQFTDGQQVICRAHPITRRFWKVKPLKKLFWFEFGRDAGLSSSKYFGLWNLGMIKS